MEVVNLMVVVGLALLVAFAAGYRSKRFREYIKKREEVTALRRQLRDLHVEKDRLEAERTAIRMERESMRRR